MSSERTIPMISSRATLVSLRSTAINSAARFPSRDTSACFSASLLRIKALLCRKLVMTIDGSASVSRISSLSCTFSSWIPSPRWADNPSRKGKATFKGDTLIFPVDTATAKCATQEARYVLGSSDGGLVVSGVGLDNCGSRRAALSGSWTKS